MFFKKVQDRWMQVLKKQIALFLFQPNANLFAGSPVDQLVFKGAHTAGADSKDEFKYKSGRAEIHMVGGCTGFQLQRYFFQIGYFYHLFIRQD